MTVTYVQTHGYLLGLTCYCSEVVLIPYNPQIIGVPFYFQFSQLTLSRRHNMNTCLLGFSLLYISFVP